MSRGTSLNRRGVMRTFAAGALALTIIAAVFGIQAGPAQAASASANLTTPSTAEAGKPMTVSWETSSPTSFDWIGLYRPSDADTALGRWFYSSTCTQAPGTAKSSG